MSYGFNDDKSKYDLEDLIALLNGDTNWFLKNSKYIYGTRSNGDTRQIIGLNANNQLVVGYGGYSNNDVDTYVEGKNIRILTKEDFVINGYKANCTSWAYLVGSASTDNFIRYRIQAGICFVEIYYSTNAGLSTSNKLLGTLPAGFRPTRQMVIVPNCDVDHLSKLWVNAGGTIYAKVASGTASVCQGTVVYPID